MPGVVGRRAGGAVLLLSTLMGCYGVASPPRPVTEEMHAHRDAVERARDAAVLGDDVGLDAAARELYDRGGVEGIPEDVRHWLVELRRTARAVEAEADPVEAIRRTALLARPCGGCHEDAGVAPVDWPSGGAPTDLDGAAAHISGAGWAVARLWEGVAAPSEEAWVAGRDVLGDPRTFGGGVRGRPIDPDAATVAVQRLEGLAWVAARSGGPDERARLLGDVLVTCAGCHRIYRR